MPVFSNFMRLVSHWIRTRKALTIQVLMKYPQTCRVRSLRSQPPYRRSFRLSILCFCLAWLSSYIRVKKIQKKMTPPPSPKRKKTTPERMKYFVNVIILVNFFISLQTSVIRVLWWFINEQWSRLKNVL